MHTLTAKFIRLKTAVGGNREKSGFEYTFGLPEEEARRITPPSRMNRRILAELEYALHLNEANGNRYEAELEQALDELLAAQAAEGVLTNQACIQAEETMAPMAELAKSYQLILTGHAHIDMNWMWSWQETVAATLSTFRTMCGIMDEYPEFTFTQSQGSVYRIVEEYDPELMERMRKHISEGRWEVAAGQEYAGRGIPAAAHRIHPQVPAGGLGRAGLRSGFCAGHLWPCADDPGN